MNMKGILMLIELYQILQMLIINNINNLKL